MALTADRKAKGKTQHWQLLGAVSERMLTIHLTFNLIDSVLDREEWEAKNSALLRHLHEFDALERVDRVLYSSISRK